MKKRCWLMLVLTLMLLVSVLFFACAQPAPEKVKLVFGAGPAGGTQQVAVEAIAEAIRRSAPNYTITVIAGSETPNLLMLGTRERDLTIVGSLVIPLAAKGVAPFEKPLDLRVLVQTQLKRQHIIVLAKTGFTSLEEMFNKKYPMKISVGRKDTAPEIGNRSVFGTLGVTYQDIESWGGKVSFLAGADTETAFKDGVIDTIAAFAELPYPRAMNLQMDYDLRLLRVKAPAPELMKKSGIVSTIVPAGTYKFVTEDIPTVADINFLLVYPDIPEEVAYTMVKSIFEQMDYLTAAYEGFKEMEEASKTYMDPPIPFHPGAVKYFKERGWLK